MVQCIKVEVTEKELRLLEKLREIGWGEVTIFMCDNQPVRIEQIKEGVKL